MPSYQRSFTLIAGRRILKKSSTHWRMCIRWLRRTSVCLSVLPWNSSCSQVGFCYCYCMWQSFSFLRDEDCSLFHSRLIKMVCVFTFFLCLVHCNVGILKKGIYILSVIRIYTDTNTCCDKTHLPVQNERFFKF